MIELGGFELPDGVGEHVIEEVSRTIVRRCWDENWERCDAKSAIWRTHQKPGHLVVERKAWEAYPSGNPVFEEVGIPDSMPELPPIRVGLRLEFDG